MKMPSVPWVKRNDMTTDEAFSVFTACERGKMDRCINTNYVKVSAKKLGRPVRYVQTYKAYVWWTEFVVGENRRYRAPLKPKYAEMIDGFDFHGKHFRTPSTPPFGPVEFVEIRVPRSDTTAVREARRARHNARVAKGVVKQGERFRDPQGAAARAVAGI